MRPSFLDMKKTVRKLHRSLSNGEVADLFQLENSRGTQLLLSSYGARWIGLQTADRQGILADVIVGHEALSDFESADAYFGCTVGRYANRIANGQFSIDGKTYHLAKNLNRKTHLHGGIKGFDQYIWHAEMLDETDRSGVRFTHNSPEGDEGYPGNLQVEVVYWLTEANEVRIAYTARTDQPTHINLTNHAYFNLLGDLNQTVLGHELQLFAEAFTATDDDLVPTGALETVTGTPLDFRQPKRLGKDIEVDDRLIRIANGYDHNFVITPSPSPLALAAIVKEPVSGRMMQVHTTQPGVQLYTANWFDGTISGKEGIPLQKNCAFCLETQHFPDSPNHPHFPSTLLLPQQVYSHISQYTFGIIE